MDTEVIANCVGPLSNNFLSLVPHHVAPSMNLHRVFPSRKQAVDDVSSLLFKPFPYLSSVPVPLTPLTIVPRKVLNGLDPTTRLIREKLKWQKKKEKLVQVVRKDKINISGSMIKKAVKQPVGSKVLPQGVVMLAQHLDKDPDPYFSGVNNWYYTGGTLATLTHNEDNYMIHPAQAVLHCSKIVDGRSELSATVDLESDDPVYQIVANTNGAAVRQKSQVSILSVVDADDGFRLNNVHRVSDKRGFLSVALQDGNVRKYSTLSNNGLLKQWDTEYSRGCKGRFQVAPGEGITVNNTWSSIQYLDNHTLLLTDRCCLHLLDVRSGMREKQLAWCPKKITEQCEQLCHVVRSCRDQVIYTATSHQLFSLDLRFGFAQRWTHMMAAPPHLGFATTIGDSQEVICLGSQIMSDCVAVVNSWKGEDPQSLYKPTSLPGPAKGLHLARQNGLCLDWTLTQRCTQSMTGLTCIPADDGLQVVRQSATADIFIQQLGSSEEITKELNEKGLAAYSGWSKPTSSLLRDPTSVTVTSVEDFSPLLEALTNVNIPVKASEENVEKSRGFSCKLSKKYLEDCVDLLAGKMLSVWDVEDEEEWCPQNHGESLVEQDPAEKVMNWLDATNTAADDNNVTEVSTLKPTVTSTPLPLVRPSAELDGPTPWMSQPTQLHMPESQQATQSTSKDYFLTGATTFSPPSSEGSDRPQRKKMKVFDDSEFVSSPRQPTVTKKPLSSAKKKFIPGF